MFTSLFYIPLFNLVSSNRTKIGKCEWEVETDSWQRAALYKY